MMFVVFFLTFQCSIPLMNLLEFGFTKLGDLVNALWPAGRLEYLHSLIVEGIIGGVGGVLVFLPNILILFLAIAFLEGTGYMARAAFVMDGFMHKFGLHGKSFIPMLLGFGCTVPAIMATRTIESERDRLTTILVLPLMSCGARLPIYSLLIPAFFPPFWQAPIMWLIYLIGVVLALLCAGILKSTLFKGEDDIFVMELPPYRMPTLRSILLYMLERTMMYLHKAGTFILTASIILFLFNTLPEKPKEMYTKDYAAETVRVEQATNLSEQEKKSRIQTLSAEKEKERLQYSIAGRIGNAMTVVFRPIGFDWKICSALIGAFERDFAAGKAPGGLHAASGILHHAVLSDHHALHCDGRGGQAGNQFLEMDVLPDDRPDSSGLSDYSGRLPDRAPFPVDFRRFSGPWLTREARP